MLYLLWHITESNLAHADLVVVFIHVKIKRDFFKNLYRPHIKCQKYPNVNIIHFGRVPLCFNFQTHSVQYEGIILINKKKTITEGHISCSYGEVSNGNKPLHGSKETLHHLQLFS